MIGSIVCILDQRLAGYSATTLFTGPVGMGFHDAAVFPDTLAAYASGGGVSWGNDITIGDGKFRTRNARIGPDGLMRYTVNLEDLSREEMHEVLAFARARHGALYGFRFKDWRDFTNHADGISDGSASIQRMQIGVGDGSKTTFQLYKFYEDSGVEVARKITHPIDGTVRVWLSDSEQTESTHFSVDVTSGIVTFLSAPTLGQTVDVSFNFHVPVTFGDDVDEFLSATQIGFDVIDLGTLTIEEIVDRGEGVEPISGHGYHDGSNLAGVAVMRFSDGYIQDWNPTGSGARIRMWDPANQPAGGPMVCVVNKSASLTLTLQDLGGSTLAVIPTESAVEVSWTGAAWRVI